MPFKFYQAHLSSMIFTAVLLAYSPSGLAKVSYANNPFGIWSALTQFEINTLNKLNKAKQGDADTLLALFIIASGDARTDKDFQRYQKKIQHKLNLIKPAVKRTKDAWQKGEILHAGMHQHFFAYSKTDQDLNSYDLNQSQLTTLLNKKTYNCISSTLLYITLARYMGLQAQGVVLSSHSFAQLTLPNKIVEIETTSKNGYDLKHDKAFYKAQSKSWHSRRGLSSSTYQDYQNREIVSPYILASLNMNNQHAQKNRIPYIDRIRLAEIAAYINPKDKQLQLNRLYVLAEEFDRLSQQKNWRFLQKLYAHTYTKIDANHQSWKQDSDMIKALSHYYSQALYSYAQLGNFVEVEIILKTHFKNLNPKLNDKKTIKNNIATSVGVLLNKAIENRDYRQGQKIINDSKNLLQSVAIWNKNVTWFYNERVKTDWQKKNWENIISIYEQYFKLNIKIDKTIENNLSGAYRNWSIDFTNKADWSGAKKVWQDCISRFKQLKICKKEYNKLLK